MHYLEPEASMITGLPLVGTNRVFGGVVAVGVRNAPNREQEAVHLPFPRTVNAYPKTC